MRITPAAFAICLVSCAAYAGVPPDQGNLALDLARVSLYSEQNQMDKAKALLDQLRERYPDNPQVLATEADLDFKMGNRGAAFAALNQASDLAPGNEDILNRRKSALLEQGTFADGGYEYRHTSEATENYVNAEAQAALSPSLSARLDVRNDSISTRMPITDIHGVARNVTDNRQMGTLTVDKVWHNGDEANASLYGNDNSAGIGAQYSAWDAYGSTALSGNIRKPDWDYPVMVIEDGTKDNIHLERRVIVTPRLQLTLGGGYNNYNLKDDTNVAGAAAWDANLAYSRTVRLGNTSDSDVTLGANYSVDAEYFTHREQGLDDTGASFRPLPVSSYEIHTLTVNAGKNFAPSLYANGYAGYGIDRLGGNGPLVGASLQYSPVEHLGIELKASHTLLGGLSTNGTSSSSTEREDIVGVNVKWKW